MSYEARDPNVYPILPTFQSVPISPMVKMLLSLNESKDGYVKTTDSGPDQDLNILHKVHGTQCSYNFKIGPNLVDGVLSINWNTRHADLDKSEVDDVKVSIYRIKALLEKIKKH
jgi:hypothetical protein